MLKPFPALMRALIDYEYIWSVEGPGKTQLRTYGKAARIKIRRILYCAHTYIPESINQLLLRSTFRKTSTFELFL